MFERFKPPGVRQEDLLERWDDERLLSQLEQNPRLIEALAVVIMKHAVDRLGIEGIDDDTSTPLPPVGRRGWRQCRAHELSRQ